MTRSAIPTHLAMLLLPALLLADDGPGQGDVPELDETRLLIKEHKLEEAQDAFKAAKKALGSRRRDKEVKAELKLLDDNLEALEEFLDAKENVEKGRAGKALKPLSGLLRTPGDLIIIEDIARLYTEVKDKAYYVVNDFETRARRQASMVTGKSGAVETEVVSDLRLSLDGRHSVKVTIGDRDPGVPEQDSKAWRWVRVKTPPDFAESIDSRKVLSFGIYSPQKQEMKLELSMSGKSSESRAAYAGIALNFVGWRTIQVPLGKMQLSGNFEWSEAKNIVLATRGAIGGTFYIDDVKLNR